MTPDRATINPTIDHFIWALAVSTLFGSPRESIYCSPAITNEITVTIPSTVSIQLRKVARTQSTGPEKQIAGNEKTLPNEVETLPVERPTPVGTQVPPSKLVPAGHETGPPPEPLPEPEPLPTPVKGGVPLEPLPDPDPELLPEPLPDPDPEPEPEPEPNHPQLEPEPLPDPELLPEPLPDPDPEPELEPEPLPLPELEPLPEGYPTEHSTAQTIKDTLPSAAQDILLKAIPVQPALLTSYVARSS